jgi:hypothetical protein
MSPISFANWTGSRGRLSDSDGCQCFVWIIDRDDQKDRCGNVARPFDHGLAEDKVAVESL